MTTDGDGQAGWVDLKGVLRDLMTTSNVEEDTSVEIGVVANSIMRVYHESGRNGKHAMLSLKDLEVSMYLKKGLLWVVNIGFRMGLFEGKHRRRKDEGSKCFDQGDGRYEGGTCMVHKEIYLMQAMEPTASGRGERYRQRIWWVRWRWRFGLKEGRDSKWRKNNGTSEEQ